MSESRGAVVRVVRESYGRLVAYLASRSRDVALAEDCLGEALRSALESWPETGVPERPEAWLLTVAKRRMFDAHRRADVRESAMSDLITLAEEEQSLAGEARFPDERLKSMFVCAHPAIDSLARTPLLLQVVLGLDAEAIAAAFLVKPSAMGQRLTRAKAKIRDARIPFVVPAESELPERLATVLEAVYGVFSVGFDEVRAEDRAGTSLSEDGLELASLLERWLPEEPEVLGLRALLLFVDARRSARRGPKGEFVPLSEQNVGLWSREKIKEGRGLLARATKGNRLGRFQLEAVIQSVHSERAFGESRTDWLTLAKLYDGLVAISPTLGASVARAVAWGEAAEPAVGLRLLDEIPPERIADFQPFWAARAEFAGRCGFLEDAERAYSRALGLTTDSAVREYLAAKERAVRISVENSGPSIRRKE